MGRKVCPSNWLLEVGQTACLAAITTTTTATTTSTSTTNEWAGYLYT